MTSHIASIIVRARPELAETVAARVARVPDTEVHANQDGKIIAVLEASTERELADRMDALRNEADVLMVSLVFHQVLEDETELS